MKKIIVTICALCLVCSAEAQDVSSKSMDSYWSIQASYMSLSLDEMKFEGIEFYLSTAQSISKSIPLFAEIGINVQAAFDNERSAYDYADEFKMYSVGMPVSIGYHYQIGNGFALAPYAGLNIRYYVSGKAEKRNSYEYKLFDSDECDWNPLAFGWQVGVKAILFKTVSLGISYGTDFTEMVENADKIGLLRYTLGFTM